MRNSFKLQLKSSVFSKRQKRRFMNRRRFMSAFSMTITTDFGAKKTFKNVNWMLMQRLYLFEYLDFLYSVYNSTKFFF